MIDSGFRCHVTSFTRATAAAPSAFVSRLRKFLRTRRVTSISQVGTDRIIELQFSDGQYRLFLEFYAGGNIVLTDRDLSIIALLRIVAEDNEQLRVGLKYSLDGRQNFNGVPTLTTARIKAGLQKAIDKEDGDIATMQKRSKKKVGDALRKALATSLNEFPPMLLEHALRVAAFDSATPVEEVLKDLSLLERLTAALGEAQKVVDSIEKSQYCKGYIIAKPAKGTSEAIEGQLKENGEIVRENLMYEDFHPFRPQQFENIPEIIILEFDGFNKTVDEFFSSIESQKLESRLTEREEHAKRKLETARLDHEKRLGGLQQAQELNVRKAQAIEANLQKIQEAIAAVNGLLAQGMDWMDVARLIEMEQERHNVVAEMIKLPLKLYENTVTLLLTEANFEDEQDFEGDETDSNVSDSEEEESTAPKSTKAPKPVDKRLAVDVDLALSPWSNARQYYDQKKSAAVKEQKTLQASEKALKSTEKKISADLKKGLKQEKEVMRPQRKAHWFEKFVYFISSEGYLVLGGKDAQQNEILYKKYLRKGDIYIHADLHGATSIIVKNKTGMSESPIPPSTLSQAGALAVATSSAWDSKAIMCAWWVNADQVSKTAPTGEYLTTGGFTVRGHKTFLPPAPLLLGFGIMFKVSEESKARHLKHRFQEDIPTKSSHTPEVASEEVQVQDEDRDDVDPSESEAGDAQPDIEDDDQDDNLDPREATAAENQSDDGIEDYSDAESKQDNPLQPKKPHRNVSESPTHDARTVGETPENGEAIDSQSSDYDSEPEEEKDEQGNVAQSTQNDQKLHLSARERRLLRSGQPRSSTDPSQATNAGVDSEDSTRPSTPATSTQSSQLTKSQPPRVRGKRGKRNKLKTKYANQDEEDRALAMRLLGSAAAQEKATDDAAAKATKEQDFAAAKERRRKQQALAAEKGKEAEKIRSMNFEEGIETLDEDEVGGLGDMDAFVGAPLPGDEILDALVVCGPWDAIGGRCKWRVKLQPGTVKKGKAVREILQKWVNVISDREKEKRPGAGESIETMIEKEKVRKREGDLIRAIREPEVVGIVPVGKVRVVMGPGEAGGKGGGGRGAGKGKRGGKGSKKQR